MKKTTKQESFQLSLVQDTFSQMRQVVQNQMRGAALALALQLFNDEVEQLCGPKFSRKSEKFCHRGGSDDGSIILHGGNVSLKKPRARKGNEEVVLQSYSALQDYDLLCNRVMNHMLTGVSTRKYEGLLDEVSNSTGLKKSSVSTAFKKSSEKSLSEINGRDLSSHEFIAIMIDGIGFGDRLVIAALGITTKGKKIIIGLREGDTENAAVCVDLLQSFFDRGLSTVMPFLFVIDGSKALKKGIRKVFGNSVPIQRCVRHKERNILSYLSDTYHAEFRRRWKKLHGIVEYKAALKEHQDLHDWLSNINHAAVQSLEEAEFETLTVVKLKTPMLLRKTLLSTNPIESAFSQVQSQVRRVKNWKSGKDQVSRWAAATLLDAEKRFRTIKGFKETPILKEELQNLLLETQTKAA
jgi:transposase-like protein